MCWIDEPSQPTSCSQSGRIDCFRLLGFLLVLLAAGPAPADDCGGGFRCQTGHHEGVTGVKGAAKAQLVALIRSNVASDAQIVAIKTDLVAFGDTSAVVLTDSDTAQHLLRDIVAYSVEVVRFKGSAQVGRCRSNATKDSKNVAQLRGARAGESV